MENSLRHLLAMAQKKKTQLLN